MRRISASDVAGSGFPRTRVNASSIAVLMLTTKALVSEIKEVEKDRRPAPVY